MRFFYHTLSLAGLVLAGTAIASAHVSVTPNQVGVAARQTFDISVPSEKDDVPTTGLRLLVPGGLNDLAVTVHPGWTIATTKNSEGKVTEIDWTAGSIPAGQRDDLTFRAQVPAAAAELAWKAYQTYADGTNVSWDKDPSTGSSSDEAFAPYSKTMVVNDLAAASATANTSSSDTSARALGVVGLIVAISALGMSMRRR
jgi:uncharacterized protein YcnI